MKWNRFVGIILVALVVMVFIGGMIVAQVPGSPSEPLKPYEGIGLFILLGLGAGLFSYD
jgi:hypothetical protein